MYVGPYFCDLYFVPFLIRTGKSGCLKEVVVNDYAILRWINEKRQVCLYGAVGCKSMFNDVKDLNENIHIVKKCKNPYRILGENVYAISLRYYLLSGM